MRQKKICMLGAYGVGKTSLVRRFVESIFDERYQTTIGVKIDKKVIAAGPEPVTLMIWDLAGEDEVEQVRISHLRGASGFVLVVDGCRGTTLEVAAALKDRIESVAGPLPWVLALNKSDLHEQWEIDAAAAETKFQTPPAAVLVTSAKSGDGVEEMFTRLAAAMVGSD
jgi:hypothetical protein